MIIFFIFSIVFLLIISWAKKITLFSPYGFFIFFSVLYNLIPYLTSRGCIDPVGKLNYYQNLIDKQLMVVAFSNIIFGIIYFIKYKQVRYIFTKSRVAKLKDLKIFYFIFYFIFFLIACYLCYKYGWNQHSHYYSDAYSKQYSITAYVKYSFVAAYLFYIYIYGLDKFSIIILILQIILMLVDGARTTFFSVFAITINIFVLKGIKIKKSKKFIASIIFIIGIFCIILTRAIIMEDSISNNGLRSIFIEGDGGSYMSLQTLYVYDNNFISEYTWGRTYIIDPLIYVFTKGVTRDNLLFYNKWINDASMYLDESFAPRGGFYYMAEGISFFPIFGPMIITGFFAFVTSSIENNKNKHRILYIVYLSTIGVLFSKQIFSNLFTIFIAILLSFLVIWFMYSSIYTILHTKYETKINFIKE